MLYDLPTHNDPREEALAKATDEHSMSQFSSGWFCIFSYPITCPSPVSWHKEDSMLMLPNVVLRHISGGLFILLLFCLKRLER